VQALLRQGFAARDTDSATVEGGDAAQDLFLRYRYAATEGIGGIAPGTAQGAAGEADEDRRQPDAAGFATVVQVEIEVLLPLGGRFQLVGQHFVLTPQLGDLAAQGFDLIAQIELHALRLLELRFEFAEAAGGFGLQLFYALARHVVIEQRPRRGAADGQRGQHRRENATGRHQNSPE
jgi:hypothetical protein